MLGTPLIFGATLPELMSNQELMDLVRNEEILAVNQDPACVEGSMLRMRDTYELWGKPLSDGNVVIVAFNKSPELPVEVSVLVYGYEGDFYPMFASQNVGRFKLRDLVTKEDIGTFDGSYFAVKVDPMDARMIKVTFA